MSSYNHLERIYRDPLSPTSILDDWNERRKEKLEWLSSEFGSFCCRFEFDPDDLPRPLWAPDLDKSVWPFDWDWNGRFCHDFPLLDLPDTVLREVMGMVGREDRIELSHTCRKLRNMLVKNKSPDMDRRKTYDRGMISLRDWTPVISVRLTKYWGAGFVEKDLPDLTSVQRFIDKMRPTLFFESFHIGFFGEDPEDGRFSKIVETLDGFAGRISGSCEFDTSPSMLPMLKSFLNCPRVHLVDVRSRLTSSKWDEYCTTVTKWGEANAVEVWRAPVESHGYPTFAKLFPYGKMVLGFSGRG